MLRDKFTRIARLEAALAPARGGVVHFDPGESAEQAIARSGKRGAVLLMPAIPDEATWEREAIAQQIALQREAEEYFRTGIVPER